MARAPRQSDEGPVKTTTGVLQFEVDSALLLQLGEELVAKRSVAVAELVKNAYDADAEDVIIEFKNVSASGGEITILDSGSGIPFNSLQRTWMRIATTDKQQNPVSARYGRPRAGAKGIGRFATRRLAEEVEIQTTAFLDPSKPSLGKEETRMHFVWADFQVGKDIQSVPVKYERRTVPAAKPTGTLLRLIGTRDAWTADDIGELRADLVRLISPLPKSVKKRLGAKEKDPGFDIVFEFPDKELEKFSGALSEDFLEQAYAVLEGTLTQAGMPSYSLRFRDEPQTAKPHRFEPDAQYTGVGKAAFKVHYFVHRSGFYGDTDFSVRAVQSVGREYGGVQITYDGFRIPPYGDEGNDWLRTDYDRARRITDIPVELRNLASSIDRPMLLLPSSNQLFGRVSLSRFDNLDIRQLASREGFRENEAFQQIRTFVRRGIDWLTVMYARHTEERRQQEREARKAEVQTPKELLSRARDLISAPSEKTTPEQRKEAWQAIGMALEAIEEQEKDQIGELQMLRVLASTGTMIIVFDHQLLGTLERLRESYRSLRRFQASMPATDRETFAETLSELQDSITDVEHQGRLLGLLLGKEARSRKRHLVIRPMVEKIANAFGSYMTHMGIVFANEVPAHLRTPPMFGCELSAILINLLTNAIKAVKESAHRQIEVTAVQSNESIRIYVKDTGRGAAKSKWKLYFEPFYSESEPDPILGAGTGLGLKIVADFVDVYGGTAAFQDPEDPWKTCIIVDIPEARHANHG